MTERFGAEIHGKDRGMPLSGVEEKQHDHLNAAGRELQKFRHSRDSGNLLRRWRTIYAQPCSEFRPPVYMGKGLAGMTGTGPDSLQRPLMLVRMSAAARWPVLSQSTTGLAVYSAATAQPGYLQQAAPRNQP